MFGGFVKGWLALLLLAGTLCAAGASMTADAAEENKQLQGVWQAISAIDNGREEPQSEVKKLTLTIEGTRYVYRFGEIEFAARFRIVPYTHPRRMDLKFETGEKKGEYVLAIFSLEGDELRVAAGGTERPADFVSRPNSNVTTIVFRRIKP